MAEVEERPLVERLRTPSDGEDTMQTWDYIRAELLDGCMGSLPRDIFEMILSSIDGEREEAADRIEELERRVSELETATSTRQSEIYTTALDEIRSQAGGHKRSTAYNNGVNIALENIEMISKLALDDKISPTAEGDSAEMRCTIVETQLDQVKDALDGLLVQALQSELNCPSHEWGYEAIFKARSALGGRWAFKTSEAI